MSGTSTLATPTIGNATYSDMVEMSGSVRGRIGYAFDRWLYYGTAGYAWTQDHLTRTQLNDTTVVAGGTVENKFPVRSGWTAGAGIEMPLVPHWTARLEYLYSSYGTASVTFPLAGQRFDSNLSIQEFRLGLNYQLGESARKAGNGGIAHVHAVTFVRFQIELSPHDRADPPVGHRAVVFRAVPFDQGSRNERYRNCRPP
jgi:high affinity Mn2+ porin